MLGEAKYTAAINTFILAFPFLKAHRDRKCRMTLRAAWIKEQGTASFVGSRHIATFVTGFSIMIMVPGHFVWEALYVCGLWGLGSGDKVMNPAEMRQNVVFEVQSIQRHRQFLSLGMQVHASIHNLQVVDSLQSELCASLIPQVLD